MCMYVTDIRSIWNGIVTACISWQGKQGYLVLLHSKAKVCYSDHGVSMVSWLYVYTCLESTTLSKLSCYKQICEGEWNAWRLPQNVPNHCVYVSVSVCNWVPNAAVCVHMYNTSTCNTTHIASKYTSMPKKTKKLPNTNHEIHTHMRTRQQFCACSHQPTLASKTGQFAPPEDTNGKFTPPEKAHRIER
jgi:hypothetical protein